MNIRPFHLLPLSRRALAPLLGLSLLLGAAARADFVLFDNFDTYTAGSQLVGQGPAGNLWTQTGGSNPAGIVLGDFAGGLAPVLGPAGGSAAYRSLVPLGLSIPASSAEATVFFQFAITTTASGANSWSFVVTDRLPTDTAGSSQVQVNYDSSAANSGGITTLRARAGGSFKFLSVDGTKAGDVPMLPDTTYSVWLLINKSASNYRVYVRNDSIPALAGSARQVFADDGTGGVFGFRNGASPNALTNINFGASGGQSSTTTFDNFYVDGVASNLTYPIPAPAVPTVNTPFFTPDVTIAYAGSAMTVSALAQGSAPLRYRWQVEKDFGGFVNVPNADTGSLPINTTTGFAPGSYTYRVIVTNGFGAVTSAPSALLTVLSASAPVAFNPTAASAATVYAGANVTFTATFEGTLPIALQWRKSADQATWTDIPGATAALLSLTHVTAADAGYYALFASNIVNGAYSASSGALPFSVLPNPPPPSSGYSLAVMTHGPIGYWRLNDPAGSAIFDYAGTNQAYNTNVTLPVPGLRSPAFPGFTAANTAGSFDGQTSSATTGAPLMNGLTNFTLIGWFNPNAGNAARAGLFGQNDVVEIGFSDAAGVNVGLRGSASAVWRAAQTGPDGFVPGNWYCATIVADGANLSVYVNGVWRTGIPGLGVPVGASAFGFNMGGGGVLDATGNYFNGTLEDIAIIPGALSAAQVKTLFETAAGQRAPVFAVSPTNQIIYEGQTVALHSVAEGADPLSYRWQSGPPGGPYTDLANGGPVSGAQTRTLVISNLTVAYAREYRAIAQNGLGSATSGVGLLTVLTTSPAEWITLSQLIPNGQDWEVGAFWSDGLPASISAVAKPGSTYEILAGGRMRSLDSAIAAVFPGDLLIVSGDGVWTNNPPAGSAMGEIRFKQAPPLGSVYFKELVMNGGQLDTGNDGVVQILGKMTVQANTPIYNDGPNDRGYQIAAQLTGAASIEYRGYNPGTYMPAYVNGLNIAGTSNTFTGSWNIVSGTLQATGKGGLGTNAITIGAQAALEAGYNLYSPHATLTLNGRFLLHGDHGFRSVIINGTPLANGTYSWAQLNALYPANFPATWTQQSGSTVSTASGSLSVGVPPPVPVQIQRVGAQVRLTWADGVLYQADALTGPWTLVAGAVSPLEVTPTGAQKFYRARMP